MSVQQYTVAYMKDCEALANRLLDENALLKRKLVDTRVQLGYLMARNLAAEYGGWTEQGRGISRVGFIDEQFDQEPGNIMSAFGSRGQHLFDFAYRPHCVGQSNYTENGLFLC